MHLSCSMEDYLEAIYWLSEDKGYARTKDIAKKLDIASPSVTEMLKKLDGLGLVSYEKYGAAVLTKKGKRIGATVAKRHRTLRRFLEILEVPEDAAESDACTLEHGLTPVTLNKLTKFVEFMDKFSESPEWLKNFRRYYRTGKLPKCPKLDNKG